MRDSGQFRRLETVSRRPMLFLILALSLVAVASASAQAPQAPRVVEAFPPFKIIGNIYYVGDTVELLNGAQEVLGSPLQVSQSALMAPSEAL